MKLLMDTAVKCGLNKVSKDQYGVYLAMRHNHFVNVLLLKETEEGFAMLLGANVTL